MPLLANTHGACNSESGSEERHALDHNQLIRAAAKSVLRPIGCTQKGRSRTWLDDRGWWVGVIEFQPSSWSNGSYLNVGACWLWTENVYLSFDHGDRIEEFHSFESPEQFNGVANSLAERAKTEILRLRSRFPTLHETATCLTGMKSPNIWHRFHAGIAAGLAGDVVTAKNNLAAIASETSEYQWVIDLQSKAAHLGSLSNDVGMFRSTIAKQICHTRTLLRLPRVDIESLLNAER